MYLAEYNIRGVAWCQLAAAIVYPAVDAAWAPRWWARFRTLLRNLQAVPQATTGLRVQLDEQLHVTLLATAPASESEQLRHAVGSFTQLDIIADGSVEYPLDRDAHDHLLEFPRFRCRVTLPALTSGDAWFAFDFRAQNHLDELIEEARALDYHISYHLNVERLEIQPQWQREAARNALCVADIAGVPSAVERLQQTLAANLRNATHVCEEFLGVETAAAQDWLRNALERRFRETFGANVSAFFSFDEEDHEGSLTAIRHRIAFEPLAVDEICAAAVPTRESLRLLSWQPAPELHNLIPMRLLSDDDTVRLEPLSSSAMPQLYGGDAEYLFISYTRTDLRRVEPVLSELGRMGHRLWYDKGIPAGAEWDALIEERLQNCAILLVFLSQSAVDSKYVRRELKFADALSKPIIVVRLDPHMELRHGLAMLVNQYQFIDAYAAPVHLELDRTIRQREAGVNSAIAGVVRS